MTPWPLETPERQCWNFKWPYDTTTSCFGQEHKCFVFVSHGCDALDNAVNLYFCEFSYLFEDHLICIFIVSFNFIPNQYAKFSKYCAWYLIFVFICSLINIYWNINCNVLVVVFECWHPCKAHRGKSMIECCFWEPLYTVSNQNVTSC